MKSDAALIDFARMIRAEQNDLSKKMLGLDICMNFATSQRKAGRCLSKEDIDGLGEKLGNKDIAQFFIERVWTEVFEGRIPGIARLGNIKAIYLGAFSNPKGAGRKATRWPDGMGGRGKMRSLQVPAEIYDAVMDAAEKIAWQDRES